MLALLAFAVRAAAPSRMAIEHFDEGVYASNLYCGHLDPPFAYPDRALYAPPFLPAMLEWILLLSRNPHSVMWMNVAAGTLTVLAVWWVTRSWFGPPAGLAAAVLAATSEFHIAFSRMALTDVLLCLWLLLGVYAGWKGILSGRPLWIGLAGLLAGLAWCTKYNGWLTLAVTGSGTAAWLVMARPGSVRWWQAALRWLGSAAIAGVLFWFVGVRPLGPGGYAAVGANHAKYFVGLSGWWSGLVRQLEVHAYVNGWVTCVGVAAAVYLLSIWRSQTAVPGGRRRAWFAGGIAASAIGVWALASGATLLFLMFTAAWLIHALWTRNGPGFRMDPQSRLAMWISAAWFLGLLVAVPLYYPYPRLSLPLIVIGWPGMAGGMLAFMERADALARSPGRASHGQYASAGVRRRPAVLLIVAVAGVLGVSYWQASTQGLPFIPARFVAWDDHRGVARGTGQLLDAMQADLQPRLPSGDADIDAVLYVYADPAAFFHLAADSAERAPRVLVHPAGNLGMTEHGATRRPVAAVYLVTGPRAHRDEAALAAVSDRLDLIGRYAYQASDLVLLDEYPPELLRTSPQWRNEELRLYRIVASP